MPSQDFKLDFSFIDFKERKGERNISLLSCLFRHSLVVSRMFPDWGSNLQPQGVEPCWNRRNRLSYTARTQSNLILILKAVPRMGSRALKGLSKRGMFRMAMF